MKQLNEKIISNVPLCDGFFEMVFTWDQQAGALNPEPGQFFTVRTSDSTVPLLRRPFAFSAYDQKHAAASMIYQKRGIGTGLLTAMGKGDCLNLIGPLGKPFSLPQKGGNALLVAGGIGVGPLLFLAATLRKAGIACALAFGCRTKGNIPVSPGFKELNPMICTDDGSAGFKGTAVDYLHSIANEVTGSTILYACGPHPMLKGCHEFAGKKGIGCQVSVEQVMACGVGACMGCAVKVTREPGFARACVEGPVFDSRDINWDR